MKKKSILILAAFLSLQFFGNKLERTNQEIGPDSLKTVTFSFVGDLMCHSPQMDFARIDKDSFDFKPVFREVKKFLSSADFTIGNLETTIAGKENHYSGYPLFNTPESYLDALKDVGFDILLTTNNHTLDRGKKGILKTIDKIQEYGMKSIGTNKSQKERDSVRIFESKGIRFTILAYTYGVNGNYISQHEQYLVNIIDTNLIKQDIKNARNKNAEVVIVYFHFGNEYQRQPNEYQKQIVKCAINSGADIIIGSHPHVIQPLKYFTSSNNKIGEGIISYSLGNFISNQRWRYSDCGVILNFSITKNIVSNKIELSNVTAMPTWVFKGKTEDKNEYVIIPSDTLTVESFLKYMSQSDRDKMNQSFDDTKKYFEAIKSYPAIIINKKVN